MLTDDDIRSIWSGMGSFLDDREADRLSFARAVEKAAYERAAAHIRTLKRDLWHLGVAPEIVIDECAVAIEKLMTQEQPK